MRRLAVPALRVFLLAVFSMAAPAVVAATPESDAVPRLDEAMAGRFARLALSCIEREYPNKITHELRGDGDVGAPRVLYPAFYGCFDWHSSVHGHWLLVRLARTFPDAPFVAEARAALARNLTRERITGELATLARGSETFERPYGLAWLLRLGADLRAWDDPAARDMAATLAPLEREAAARLQRWLPKLTAPIRSGEHAQTAFAFSLVLEATADGSEPALRAAVLARSRDFHLADRDCPLAYEPSGQDFVSPCLGEADLMRRVLEPRAFARWLDAFLPRIPRRADAAWLAPGVVHDASDGKLAHLDGLNLSRAWALEGIAEGLPPGDRRIPALRAAAVRHAQAGLGAVGGEHYAGAHWLGSFATLLLTRGSP